MRLATLSPLKRGEGKKKERRSPSHRRLLVSYGRLAPAEFPMTVSIGHLQPIVALIAGVLILIMPRLLNFIVAIYLILIGIIGLGIIK